MAYIDKLIELLALKLQFQIQALKRQSMKQFGQQKKHKDFHQTMNNFITKYGFDKIDKYEFLKIKIKDTQIKPSQFVLCLCFLAFLIFLIYDGAAFICSIGCYLIPTILCLKQLSNKQCKKNFEKDQSFQNQKSNHNVSYTDEQLMKMESGIGQQSNIATKYIVYFVFYTLCQAMTPLYCILFSDFSWTIIRLVICFFMLYPETNFSQKLWKTHIQNILFRQRQKIQ